MSLTAVVKKPVIVILFYLLLLAPLAIIAIFKATFEVHVAAPPAPISLPDFSVYKDVQQKKQAFYEYLLPRILRANQQLLNDRSSLLSPFTALSELKRICFLYARDCDVIDVDKKLQLLSRIDIIPPSLALAQAAMESGWGSSRFARQGFNLFGHWCFTKGCGLVPRYREKGSVHEVKIFASPLASVRAYFLNLNTHPRYRQLRQQRLLIRMQGHDVTGMDLVGFLGSYSQRGQDYIDEIEQMLIYNKLEATADDPFWFVAESYLAMPALPKLLQVKSPLMLRN